MSEIRAKHITIAYDDKTVIQNLSTKIADGKITTIIGANGCGKSTLLKALTRIQAVKAGQILIDGKDIAPVLVIEYGKSDYLEMMTNLGKVFDKEDKAQKWLDSWKTKTAKAKEELAPYLDASTSFTVMDFYDKAIYLYGNNWGRGGELIYDSLGFSAPETVKKDVFSSGWFVISQEVLADYVGDYLVLNVSKDTKDAAASLKESDVWKNIPAVKNQKVLEVDENLFYFSDPMSLDKQLETFTAAIKKANS